MNRRPRIMRGLLVSLVLVLPFTSCESGSRPPIGRAENGPARFEFVSTWEPSIVNDDYATFVNYSFVVQNVGGRAGAPACDILFRGGALEGWSEGADIGVGDEGRVTGEALLPQDVAPKKVLPRLEPRCLEASGDESMAGVSKRFLSMEGDEAYYALKRRGFQIRFGPGIARAERLNMRGHLSHPEVVITALERESGTKIVTITEVDCVGREADIC